jgi:hypothetical protein
MKLSSFILRRRESSPDIEDVEVFHSQTAPSSRVLTTTASHDGAEIEIFKRSSSMKLPFITT